MFATAVMAAACAAPAAAQHVHTASPYAGREKTGIAALTAQQIEELRSGAGMGFALAAELNHFPGPRHVLELADSLGLTREQRAAVEDIRQRMTARAVELGGQILEAEQALDQRFAHAHIDAAVLEEMTARIAALYGRLRATHLAAHIDTRARLTPAQISAYDRLRGYGG
jgi:Spy/CpxP family protein refolding chaperone